MSKDNSKISNEESKPASPESLVNPSSPATPELTESELDKASGGALKTYLKTPDITPIGTQFTSGNQGTSGQ